MTDPVIVDDTRPTLVRATLNSPATRNRLDGPFAGGIVGALERAERTPGARVFVLDAAGDTFCAGMSLGASEQAAADLPVDAVQELLTRLSRSPLVTVALVDAPAIGGGVGLAAVCDQVVVGPGASFRLTEVLLGLLPAMVLPPIARRTGRQRAFAMALTACELTARQAERAGLADRWARDPEVELRRLLRQLRAADPVAVQSLKRYCAELFAPPREQRELIAGALGERLDDPGLLLRLSALREQGLLS